MSDILDTTFSGELVGAAAAGDLAKIERCLDSGFAIDAIAINGLTPLGTAASEGQVAAIKLLLGRGARVDALDHHLWPPLHWAARLGTPEAIDALVQGGAQVGAMAQSYSRQSALHAALEFRKGPNAVALIRAGAAVAQPNGRGILPLNMAAEVGLEEACKELIARGANPNRATAGDRRTPLAIAAERGWTRIIDVLIAGGAKVNAANSVDKTALWLAASYGKAEACRLLIGAGANVGRANIYGCTPEQAARDNRHDDLADWLSCVALSQRERKALEGVAKPTGSRRSGAL